MATGGGGYRQQYPQTAPYNLSWANPYGGGAGNIQMYTPGDPRGAPTPEQMAQYQQFLNSPAAGIPPGEAPGVPAGGWSEQNAWIHRPESLASMSPQDYMKTPAGQAAIDQPWSPPLPPSWQQIPGVNWFPGGRLVGPSYPAPGAAPGATAFGAAPGAVQTAAAPGAPQYQTAAMPAARAAAAPAPVAPTQAAVNPLSQAIQRPVAQGMGSFGYGAQAPPWDPRRQRVPG